VCLSGLLSAPFGRSFLGRHSAGHAPFQSLSGTDPEVGRVANSPSVQRQRWVMGCHKAGLCFIQTYAPINTARRDYRRRKDGCSLCRAQGFCHVNSRCLHRHRRHGPVFVSSAHVSPAKEAVSSSFSTFAASAASVVNAGHAACLFELRLILSRAREYLKNVSSISGFAGSRLIKSDRHTAVSR
jgi:hypothetical protein